MAQVVGGLFGLGATGTLAKTLTYSTWKGRPYVRRRVIPANPKSANQLSVRAVMQWLTQQWASVPASEQSDWIDKAAETNIAPFNSYVGENLFNWRSFLAPSQFYPITRTGTLQTTPTLAAAGGLRLATVSTDMTTVNAGWGILIFRSTSTGFTPGFGNLVHVNLGNTLTQQDWVDTPLDAGTYYYNGIAFTTDGNKGSAIGEQSAVVT